MSTGGMNFFSDNVSMSSKARNTVSVGKVSTKKTTLSAAAQTAKSEAQAQTAYKQLTTSQREALAYSYSSHAATLDSQKIERAARDFANGPSLTNGTMATSKNYQGIWNALTKTATNMGKGITGALKIMNGDGTSPSTSESDTNGDDAVVSTQQT